MLFDRLLLTYLVLTRNGSRNNQSVRDVLLTIYTRSMPSTEMVSKLCEMIPNVFVDVLVDVVKK